WSAIGFADGAVRASSGVMTVGETGNTAVPTITAPNFFVGFNGEGNSTLTMAGNAEAYTGNGIMIARNYSGAGVCRGTLTMTDSAKLTSPWAAPNNGNLTFNVGYGLNSVGAMTMSDDTQATISNWHAFIGYAGGTGTLTLEDNAQMTVNTKNPDTGDLFGYVNIGTGITGTTGSQGTINLGGKSSLTFNNAFDVLVGAFGSNDASKCLGVVNVSGGTNPDFDLGATLRVNNSVIFGIGVNAQGDLNVGEYAAVSVGGSMIVGQDGAQGNVTISGNASVTTGGSVYTGVNGGTAAITMIGNGRITASNWFALARNSGTATLRMSGDTSLRANGSFLGIGNAYNGTGSGEAWLSGNATLSCPAANGEVVVAWGGTGVLHIGDGTETDNVVVTAGKDVLLGFDSNGAHATINLNGGGTLETPYITSSKPAASTNTVTSILNFDGGLLKATASDTTTNPFISNYGGSTTFALNVMDGGARIDTNGYNATITEALLAGETNDGGLTKLGAGTLTLASVANTYTGDTIVDAGTLSITNNTVFDDESSVYLEVDAILNLDFTSIGDVVEQIAGLYFDGVAQTEGTWGALGNTYADYTSAYLTGTGMLSVGSIVKVPGDTNGDRLVDDTDAKTLANNWGVGPGATWAMGDFNKDGYVNAIDASILAAQWGDHRGGESSASAVPEPSALTLVLLGCLAALIRRTR
ncbi:MAG: hypothetical protein GX621_03530, partial [Pirellulaceae bacterium]|nr:hypothetical protein [Pirellulaceae bacterium]